MGVDPWVDGGGQIPLFWGYRRMQALSIRKSSDRL